MSKIRVSLESVKVLHGQGVGEGDLELRVWMTEAGKPAVYWPGPEDTKLVDKGGAPVFPNRTIGTYDVASGTLTKRFTVNVIEVDKLGEDDSDGTTVTVSMTPSMAPKSYPHTFVLRNGGQVQATLVAERV